jgi:hypothetical protein
VDVHIDQARQESFPGGLNNLGFEECRIGKGALINLFNLPILD